MRITFDIVSARLIKSQLEAGIDQLEKDADNGSYNTLCIRALGRAAKAMGYQAICDRVLRLLQVAPNEAFFAGILTNIELPPTFFEGMRTLDSPEEERDPFPPYQEEAVVERINSFTAAEEHIALCLAGRFKEARANSASGRHLEEVGETLAVLGEFAHAKSLACDSNLEVFRRQGVRIVLVIELFRRRRTEEAATLLRELEAEGLEPWDRMHIALGFAGREPWPGYPYPDW